jgi:hypothetical protein
MFLHSIHHHILLIFKPSKHHSYQLKQLWQSEHIHVGREIIDLDLVVPLVHIIRLNDIDHLKYQ